MSTRCSAAVDPRICPHRGLETLVSEKLLDGFEASRVAIQDNLCAQVPKLVRRDHDTGVPFQTGRDQRRHRPTSLWRAVDIHEQPCGAVTDDLWREAIAILDQHLGNSEWNIEGKVCPVFHLAGWQFQCRDRTRAFTHE